MLLPFAILASVFTLNWHATPIYCTSMSGAPWDAVGVYHDTTTRTIEIRAWERDAIRAGPPRGCQRQRRDRRLGGRTRARP